MDRQGRMRVRVRVGSTNVLSAPLFGSSATALHGKSATMRRCHDHVHVCALLVRPDNHCTRRARYSICTSEA